MESTSTHKIQITALSEAYKHTQSLSPKWELLGDQLGISDLIIKVINDKDKSGCEDKLRELLVRWLQQQGGEQQCTPSWKTLSEAVRHFDANIADTIVRDHQCNCEDCVVYVDQMQRHDSSSMGGVEPNHGSSPVTAIEIFRPHSANIISHISKSEPSRFGNELVAADLATQYFVDGVLSLTGVTNYDKVSKMMSVISGNMSTSQQSSQQSSQVLFKLCKVLRNLKSSMLNRIVDDIDRQTETSSAPEAPTVTPEVDSIRNSSVCNNVRNRNVKEAFVALKKEFKQLGVFTSKEIARVDPGDLRYQINDYMGNEWIGTTALEDHMRALTIFKNSRDILDYLRRYNLIGSINFDLLSVIQEAADSKILNKRIEEYEKEYHCFLQLSLNDMCTAYKDCPDLLREYPVGLPKFIIHLESEWGGRKAYEWKEVLKGHFNWTKGINIVRIHKNCIVITYAVWPSMAKAVASDLTSKKVLSDLKALGVTCIDVSPQLLEFIQPKKISPSKLDENFTQQEQQELEVLTDLKVLGVDFSFQLLPPKELEKEFQTVYEENENYWSVAEYEMCCSAARSVLVCPALCRSFHYDAVQGCQYNTDQTRPSEYNTDQTKSVYN